MLNFNSNLFIFYVAKELCGKVMCKSTEVCDGCGENPCNQYTCDEPIKPNCTIYCFAYTPTCVCKPYFHRLIPNGPCVPLNCPEPCPPKRKQ